ncbi:MAG: serine hydrolase domain-containing protein [Gemmatimonadota bacterium]
MKPPLRSLRVAALLWVACAAPPASAQILEPATPASVGISEARLERWDRLARAYVDSSRIAGVVSLVARDGKLVHLRAYGSLDVEEGRPMRTDALFRIASMTKAVTSVAAMMLVEEGRLALDEPVSRYIPAFAASRVAVPDSTRFGGLLFSERAPSREITVRDLLTHTSGISYGGGRLAQRYQEAGVYLWYFADKPEPIGTTMERLATLPFEAHPGSAWVYGFSTDVLGRVVEVASGLPLDRFFRERIFEPLGMRDTHFYPPASKADRMATVYSANAAGQIHRAADEGMGQGDYLTGPRQSFSGGAGLVSTAQDYARFLQALLDGGRLGDARILAPATVDLMTVNHVDTLYRQPGRGFGLGFEILEDPGAAGLYGSPGTFGWGSAYYSTYWVDPQERLVGIFLAQLVPAGGLDLQPKFRTLVYQAITGPVP